MIMMTLSGKVQSTYLMIVKQGRTSATFTKASDSHDEQYQLM